MVVEGLLRKSERDSEGICCWHCWKLARGATNPVRDKDTGHCCPLAVSHPLPAYQTIAQGGGGGGGHEKGPLRAQVPGARSTPILILPPAFRLGLAGE